MNTLDVKKLILGLGRGEILQAIAVIFSLLYHVSFLFVFYSLGVMPMFYFNIFSVALFIGLTIATFKAKPNDYTVIYTLELFEVVAHQIAACHYLGGSSAFYYLILSMGFLGILLVRNRLPLMFTYASIATVTCIILAIRTPYIPEIYEIPEIAMIIIRSVNIVCGEFLNFFEIAIFASMSLDTEAMLQEKINNQREEIEIKNNKVLELNNHMIYSLANLVENRDSDTGNHIKRTSAYVELIARKAFENGIYPETITEEFISLIKLAAPLHDIGKIIVSDNILKKPGKLTPKEFDDMKVHTTEGRRIVNEIIEKSDDKDYIKIAQEVAEYHHEKWNGKGYPKGLKGEEIPVSARIMSIADVFDALVSVRCYKNAFPVEEAFSIIEEDIGVSFDPVLAKLFLESKDEIMEII